MEFGKETIAKFNKKMNQAKRGIRRLILLWANRRWMCGSTGQQMCYRNAGRVAMRGQATQPEVVVGHGQVCRPD